MVHSERHRPAYYLITERDVEKLLDAYFGLKVRTPIIGIMGFGPTRILGRIDWFWYVRFDEGFQYDGRTVYSVFVLPYAIVHDAKKVRLDDQVTIESTFQVSNSLIKDRFFAFEGEDTDPYRFETKLLQIDPELQGGKVQRSDFHESFTLVPLVPENRPPDSGDFDEMKAMKAFREKGNKG